MNHVQAALSANASIPFCWQSKIVVLHLNSLLQRWRNTEVNIGMVGALASLEGRTVWPCLFIIYISNVLYSARQQIWRSLPSPCRHGSRKAEERLNKPLPIFPLLICKVINHKIMLLELEASSILISFNHSYLFGRRLSAHHQLSNVFYRTFFKKPLWSAAETTLADFHSNCFLIEY